MFWLFYIPIWLACVLISILVKLNTMKSKNYAHYINNIRSSIIMDADGHVNTVMIATAILGILPFVNFFFMVYVLFQHSWFNHIGFTKKK